MSQLDQPNVSEPVEAAGRAEPDRPAETGGPGVAAPLMSSNAWSGSLLTLPLRTAAGALRLTAEFVAGLARRIDDAAAEPARTSTRRLDRRSNEHAST